MGRYLLRRLGFALLLVFVVSSAALLLTRLAPFDTIDQVERARITAEFGLDRPLAVQYLSWLGGVARFDFGRSLLYSRPVSTLISERALNTAVLASVALVFLAARTGWLPVGGMTSAAGMDMTWSQWLVDLARHVPVPALALAIPLAAALERLQSQAIASAARERFVAASRARGLERMQSLLRHAWPVSLRPVLGLYGVMIGSLFSGSFVVEIVTSWPGLGRLMFDALKARDLFLVAGCAATGALFLAIGTLIADLLLAWTDPRIGSGERA